MEDRLAERRAPPPRRHARRAVALTAALTALLAAVALYRSAWSASNLEIRPDSVEYAFVGHRIAFDGSWRIVLQGRELPSRYPPWFSMLVVAPAYALLGGEPGNAIFPVSLFGVFGILLAFDIGRRLSGTGGGVAASMVLLAMPAYRFWGRHVMTDVPATALILAACWLYVGRERPKDGSGRRDLLAGTVVGLAALFRPTCAAGAVPFLAEILLAPRAAGRLRRLLLLLLPMAAAAALGFGYHFATFGSAWRSGYHFWCPVPYDYPWLVFSTSYGPANVAAMLRSGLPALVAASALAWPVTRLLLPRALNGAAARDIAVFGLLTALPIAAFHVTYFYADARFHLPAVALAAVLLGGVLGAWLAWMPGVVLPVALGIALVWMTVSRAREDGVVPTRRVVADRLLRETPSDAVIITAIEPAYLELLVARGSSRLIVPISRRIEYADKPLAWKRIDSPDPPPRHWLDHRCEGILAGGAEDAIVTVAAEQPDEIERLLSAGRRVFLETSHLTRGDDEALSRLGDRFRLDPLAGALHEVRLAGDLGASSR